MYRQLIFPLLKRVDPESTHDNTIRLLEIAQGWVIGRALLRILAGNVTGRRVSLGKQKETEIENAAGDYKEVMTIVAPYADYLAINVSSPNTLDLRRLQGAGYLDQLLEKITDHNFELAKINGWEEKPIVVKIAPDLTFPDIDLILESALKYGIQGIVATNTTVIREGVNNKNSLESGGLSGLPVAEKSNEAIAYISQRTQKKLPIIGVGGVFSADDVRTKLVAGASLVQIYTRLIYEGPRLAGRILRAL